MGGSIDRQASRLSVSEPCLCGLFVRYLVSCPTQFDIEGDSENDKPYAQQQCRPLLSVLEKLDADLVDGSRQFKWYKKDFVSYMKRHHSEQPATLFAYVAIYLSNDKAASLAKVQKDYGIGFIPYDCGLNDRL